MATENKLHRVYGVIRVVRNQRVILDADLARLYGVPTKRLNEAVKRNISRFPRDFMFLLSQPETSKMLQKHQQIDISNSQPIDYEELMCPRSQFATLNAQDAENEGVTEYQPPQSDAEKRGRNIKHLPYAFSEHGAVMAAMVLNSPQATEMSVFIVRTFMKMREHLLSTAVLAKRLAEIEKTVLTHDAAVIDLYDLIQPLLLPPPEPERKPIGFCVREEQTPYRVRKSKKPRTKTSTLNPSQP